MPYLPLLADAGSNALYITVLFIFLTAIVSAVLTKWAKDKCLKFFDGYHATLEGVRGNVDWGRFKCFSSGLELVYDHAYIDTRGRKKTSYLVYQQELEQLMLSGFRYHDELDPVMRALRLKQIHRTFNPGPIRRMRRKVRNFINTLKDAFSTAIGTAVSQYQAKNPALASQSGNVTQIGQTILGRIANAYEPLLEQYIGQPVILEVADPINPNNATVQYVGYLADYTQQFIAVFNVEHTTAEWIRVTMPDVEQGEVLPPLPPPPAAGAAAPVLPPPLKVEQEIAVRVSGRRMRVQNLRYDPVVVRRLEREGYEPLELGVVIPPNGTVSLPARDAQGGVLVMEVVRCMDVIAPRKYATVRNAGELVERRGLADELRFESLPLVPTLLGTGK